MVLTHLRATYLLLAMGQFMAGQPLAVTGPPPSITNLDPSQGIFLGPAFTLTVNGANFLPGAMVDAPLVGSPFATTFVSSSQLTAAIPASALVSEEAVPFTVVNPDGQPSAPATFIITGSPCSFTFSPPSLSLP